MLRLLVPLILTTSLAASAAETASQPVLVPAGVYSPFFRDEGEKDKSISALSVDKYAVTNQEFQRFVRANPEWKKSRIKKLFATDGYLGHWKSDDSFDAKLRHQPVTNVSWFAARKYCESQGKRLPTIAEWEYVSDAQNPQNLNRILEWYGQKEQLVTVAQSAANSFGIYGMHGLVWEWVDDFSSAIIMGDSRSTNETTASMFCGAGSLKAKDPAQYATFMRFAYRSSLKANSIGQILGFRCIQSVQKGESL